MSDDEGFGGLFGGVDDEVPEYPLKTIEVDRMALAQEGATYSYFTPLLDRFDHISSPGTAAEELTHQRERLAKLSPAPFQVHFREKRHSLWGHKLWNAAKYMVKRMDEQLIDVRGKQVLELGAGLGVPTLAAFKNGANLCVVTDYPDADLLDVIALNVEANCAEGSLDADVVEERKAAALARQKQGDEASAALTAEQVAAAVRTRCFVEPLLWGNQEHIDKVMSYTVGGAGYDVVILSDILFNHVCNNDLADTLAKVLAKNEKAAGYCVFSHHRAFKQLHDFEFLDMCVHRGLKYEQVDEQDYPMMFPEDRGPEEVRQPVKCYKITRYVDEAGMAVVVPPGGFDVVLHGTGLSMACLSAALSRSGLRVLHCEGDDHYGGGLSSLSLEDFVSCLAGSEGETRRKSSIFVNRLAEEASGTVAERRRYVVDLLPMVFMSRGPLITQMVRAGMTSSLEFQHLHRLLFLQHRPEQGENKMSMMEVPLSRSAIFSTSAIALQEKRRVMKFVKDIEASLAEELHAKTANPADDPNFHNTSVVADAAADKAAAALKEAAKEAGVTLQQYMKQRYELDGTALDVATLMGEMDLFQHLSASHTTPVDSFMASIDMTRHLLRSCGGYGGRTPYLVTAYGAAEVAQFMCRTSAVWGGCFVLRRSVTGVVVDDVKEKQYAVLSNGQRIQARVVVCASEVEKAMELDVQDWLLDFERAREAGKVPLCPPTEAMAKAVAAPRPVEDADNDKAQEVCYSRVVLVTKSRLLFSWGSLQAAGLPIKEGADPTDLHPVVVSLVREPQTGAVVKIHQQTAACDQAPAALSGVETHAEGEGPCIIHFTATASELSSEALEDYVKKYFISSSPSSSSALSESVVAIPEEDVLLAASFELNAAEESRRSMLPRQSALPQWSETHKTHPFALGESTKLRLANEQDRRHLVHDEDYHNRGEDEDDEEKKEEVYVPAAVRAAEACRGSEFYCVRSLPSLQPTLLYDSSYFEVAASLFEQVVKDLKGSLCGRSQKEKEALQAKEFHFFEQLPPSVEEQ